MTSAHSKLSSLTESDRRRLEAWLDDFQAAWHPELLRERVRSLPPEGDALRQAALEEMAQIDLMRQWENGRQLPIEWYLATYPELGTRTTVSVGLLQAEYEAQRAVGEPADVADFAKRFPHQAEELRKLVEVSGRVRPGTLVEDPRRSTDSERSSTQPGAKGSRVSGELPKQFGRYRIIKRLGQGAMGAVFLAQDTQLGRQVALKVPRLRPEDGPEFLERFYREARAAATLDHPNLCSVFDVGQIDGIYCLTMAYIDGKPLSEFVDPEVPLPERQVAAVVRKLAAALNEAHSHGVIHRDLKPSNIMINKRREPVVMDFGLARQMQTGEGRLTQRGMMIGSPAYMSPEQMSGDLEAMGPSCDIYSLGVILYELLTGRLPFDGSVASIMGQIMVKEPDPPSVYRPDLDPCLESICLKAMAKQVEDRYASMDAVAQALGEYLHDGEEALPEGEGFTSQEPYQKPSARRLFVRFVDTAKSPVLSRRYGSIGAGGIFSAVAVLVVALTVWKSMREKNADGTTEAVQPVIPAAVAVDDAPARSAVFEFEEIADRTLAAGDTLRMRAILRVDGETRAAQRLGFGLEGVLPAFVTIEPTTGEITYSPARSDVGQTFDVIVKATDLETGRITRTSFKIHVREGPMQPAVKTVKQPVNRRPNVAIVKMEPLEPRPGGALRIELTGEDPEDARVSFDYRIGGQDGWKSVEDRRIIIEDLTTGVFTLQVRSVDEQGAASEVLSHVFAVVESKAAGTAASKETETEKGSDALAVVREFETSAFAAHPKFSDDGSRFVTFQDDSLSVWDVTQGKLIRKIEKGVLTRHTQHVDLSRSGQKVLTTGFDNVLRVWDVGSGRCDITWDLQERRYGSLFTAEFSPNGPVVFAVFYGEINSLDLKTGKQLGYIGPCAGQNVPSSWCLSGAISADGKRAVSGGDGLLMLWDLEQLNRKMVPPSALAIKRIRKPGRFIRVFLGGGFRRALTFEGDRFYSGRYHRDYRFRLWDLDRGVEITPYYSLKGRGAALSPDGSHLLVADHKGVLNLWDVDDGKIICSTDEPPQPYDLAFSPDGIYALSTHRDRVVLWRVSPEDAITQ